MGVLFVRQRQQLSDGISLKTGDRRMDRAKAELRTAVRIQLEPEFATTASWLSAAVSA